MSDESRRAFLKRLARGGAYVAPVVASLAAPVVDLLGQGASSQHKPGAAPTYPGATPGNTPSNSLPSENDAPWKHPSPSAQKPSEQTP